VIRFQESHRLIYYRTLGLGIAQGHPSNVLAFPSKN